MYTKGIRKILIMDGKGYGDLSKLCSIAHITKHLAILHNGQVYVKVGGSWELSPFTIDDFTD